MVEVQQRTEEGQQVLLLESQGGPTIRLALHADIPTGHVSQLVDTIRSTVAEVELEDEPSGAGDISSESKDVL